MNSSRTLLLATLVTGALVTCIPARAQQLPPAHSALGVRYLAADVSLENPYSSRLNNEYAFSPSLNLPLKAGLDAVFGYDFGRQTGDNFSQTAQNLSGTLVAYNRVEYGAAYLSATLGHEWNRIKTFGVRGNDNDGLWGVGVGVEMPVATWALNFGIGYSDYFDSDRGARLRYHLQASHWINATTGIVGTVAYNQIKNGPDTIEYRAGLRFRF